MRYLSGIRRGIVERLGLELVLVDRDLHLLPAEHVAGAHQQREAESARKGDALLGSVDGTEGGIRDVEVAQQR